MAFCMLDSQLLQLPKVQMAVVHMLRVDRGSHLEANRAAVVVKVGACLYGHDPRGYSDGLQMGWA